MLRATVDSREPPDRPLAGRRRRSAGSTSCTATARPRPARRLRLGGRPRPGHARARPPAGLLHAPSTRPGADRRGPARPGRQRPRARRWDLDLTSRQVRDADRIAEHVRVGAAPRRGARPRGRADRRRGAGRRAPAPRLPRARPSTPAGGSATACRCSPPSPFPVPLDAEQRRPSAGRSCATALDAYGDLLVAEAVHHVTEGRAEVAGAVMDAAAGLARPPELGLLRTPREGRAVSTASCSALRARRRAAAARRRRAQARRRCVPPSTALDAVGGRVRSRPQVGSRWRRGTSRSALATPDRHGRPPADGRRSADLEPRPGRRAGADRAPTSSGWRVERRPSRRLDLGARRGGAVSAAAPATATSGGAGWSALIGRQPGRTATRCRRAAPARLGRRRAAIGADLADPLHACARRRRGAARSCARQVEPLATRRRRSAPPTPSLGGSSRGRAGVGIAPDPPCRR